MEGGEVSGSSQKAVFFFLRQQIEEFGEVGNSIPTLSTAVEQVVACALAKQRARVRFPVGTSFLGEVFSGFFLTCKTNVRKL